LDEQAISALQNENPLGFQASESTYIGRPAPSCRVGCLDFRQI